MHVRFTGIFRRIVVAEFLHNLRQRVVFPTNQDIPLPGILVHDVFDAGRIVAVAGRVNRQTEVVGDGLDGVEGAFPFSI